MLMTTMMVVVGHNDGWQQRRTQQSTTLVMARSKECCAAVPFSMFVLVDFYSRHFAGTPPQTMVSAACPSPNGPLGNVSMPRYLRAPSTHAWE